MSLLQKLLQLKDEGNALFQSDNINGAIDAYTSAADLFLPPTSEKSAAVLFAPEIAEPLAAIYSNRSMCYCNRGNYRRAFDDANKVIALRPTWPRGFCRRSVAAEKLKNFEQCVADAATVRSMDKAFYEANGDVDAASKSSAAEIRREQSGIKKDLASLRQLMSERLRGATTKQAREEMMLEFFGLAMQTQIPPVIDVLLELGLKVSIEMIFGLIDSADPIELPDARPLCISLMMLQLLLAAAVRQQFKVPMTALTVQESNPLHFACSPYVPSLAVVKVVFSSGIQSIDCMACGCNALGVVCGSGVGRELPRGYTMRDKEDARYQVAAYLIENGINVNTPDSDGFTALMCLGEYHHPPEMFKLLLSHGADLHYVYANPTAGGLNALGRAITNNEAAVVQVLIAAGAKLVEETLADGTKFAPDLSRLVQRGRENANKEQKRPSLDLVRIALQQNDYQGLAMTFVPQSTAGKGTTLSKTQRQQLKAEQQKQTKMLFASAFSHGQSMEIVEYLFKFDTDVMLKTKTASDQIWQVVADALPPAHEKQKVSRLPEVKALMVMILDAVPEFRVATVFDICQCGCEVQHVSNILGRGNIGREFLDWMRKEAENRGQKEDEGK